MPDKQFEMEQIYLLEARQQELATMNKVNAPELMQAFINGYGAATRALIQLQWELTQAQKHLDERKAVVFLDIAPGVLAAKGLVRPSNPAGSQDQREAVLALDTDYKSLKDRYSMIEAAVEFLKSKAKGFEQSFQTAKKVYDSLSSTNALAVGVTRPAGSMSDPGVGGVAIGNPRY